VSARDDYEAMAVLLDVAYVPLQLRHEMAKALDEIDRLRAQLFHPTVWPYPTTEGMDS
jgi:hypothetical protein